MKQTHKVLLIIVTLVVLGGGAYLATQSKNSGMSGTQHGEGQPVAQSHRGYEIEVISGTSNVQRAQPTMIKYRIVNDLGETIKDYDVVHEKIMHFIAVRKDLQYFQHLHPEFNKATGEFSANVTFPADGPYRIYPDFTPDTDNPMQLPVTVSADVEVGNAANYKPTVVTADVNKSKTQEDYQINYSLPNRVTSQSEVTYTLTINKDGQPVTNLEQYLGALGHSVIIKEGTLDFIHTHAGDAADAGGSMGHGSMGTQPGTSGPDINFTTTYPEAGVYKMFSQFQHEGKVITTDFVTKVN